MARDQTGAEPAAVCDPIKRFEGSLAGVSAEAVDRFYWGNATDMMGGVRQPTAL